MDELAEKRERVARLCRERAVDAILLTSQPNFAWITGGRSNRIDRSTEAGNGGILIHADGRLSVVASSIEMPRIRDEVLAGVGADAIEYPWTDDEAGQVVRHAVRATGGMGRIGVDWRHEGGEFVGPAVARARAPLTGAEIARYRALGRDIGAAIERLCRTVQPGNTEEEIARRIIVACSEAGARAPVVLVAADDRIARYRHPIPTLAPWRQRLMVVVCAERDGLVVALTRLVNAGPVPPDLEGRTRAVSAVFERLLGETRAGAAGRDLFASAVGEYKAQGYPGEEARHHQGGAIGYRSRDWIAHPGSEEQVAARQAFAWNPSITGTKVEDTALLVDGELEIITGSAGWPTMPIRVHGQDLGSAAELSLATA